MQSMMSSPCIHCDIIRSQRTDNPEDHQDPIKESLENSSVNQCTRVRKEKFLLKQ